MGNILSNSAIYQIIGKVADVASPEKEPQRIGLEYDDSELQLLAQAISADYLESAELLDRLAQVYGFEYGLFWQPCVHTKKTVSDEEIRIDDPSMSDTVLAELYKRTTDSLAAESPLHFFDITDVFGSDSKVIFIDWSHVSEEGNEEIANRIYQIFTAELMPSP